MLAQKRGAEEMENSKKLEEPQGKQVNFSSGVEQAAAAAELQEGEMEGKMLAGGVEEEMGEDEDDDSWRERIDLRAVECCDHRAEMSTPPYPFYQYWDVAVRHQEEEERLEELSCADAGFARLHDGQQCLRDGGQVVLVLGD